MNSRAKNSVAITALLTLALTGCTTGGGSATGSTSDDGDIKGGPGVNSAEKSITVADLATLTGPAAVLGEATHAGMNTCVDAANAAGGIEGWKVKLLVKDSAYDPAQQVQLFNEVKDDVAAVASFGTVTTSAIRPLIQRERVLTLPQGFDIQWGAEELFAPVGPPFSIGIANGLDYVTEGGTKDLTAGMVYQDDEAGADGRRGFQAAQEEYGFEDAGQLPYKVGDTDFTTQVQRLKSAGADVVAIVGTPGAAGSMVGTAASLGFEPQWVFFGSSFLEPMITSDGTIEGEATPLAAPLTGVIVSSVVAPWGDESAPGMEEMLKDQERFAPKQEPSTYYTYGYSDCKVLLAILEKAIANGDLSREGLVEAKLSLGEVDLKGLAPNVTYSTDAQPATRLSQITEIDPSVPGFLRSVSAGHLGDAAKAIDIE